MEISAELQALLLGVLQENFHEDIISEIEVESINVDHEAGEVRIELKVSTSVAPEVFAKGYFGLTNLVHRSLKDNTSTLGDFFPIITPIFGQRANA